MTRISEKFEKRLNQVKNADFYSFQTVLREFWQYFDSEPILSKIESRITQNIPNLKEIVDSRMNGSQQLENLSIEYRNAASFQILRRIAEVAFNLCRTTIKNCIYPQSLSFAAKQVAIDNGELEIFKGIYLTRFQNCIENELETTVEDELKQSEIFRQLIRYKHHCEWFDFERLFTIYKIETQLGTQKAERKLASDLYSYLHSHGIDFYIEPKSVKGSVDFISAQIDDPILADAKIFDGEDRSKRYICSGFVQVYIYSRQYNKPSAFLIIYNVSERDLELDLKRDENSLAYFDYNGKRIYFLTIDIFPNEYFVSKRKKLSSVKIQGIDLVTFIDTKIKDNLE